MATPSDIKGILIGTAVILVVGSGVTYFVIRMIKKNKADKAKELIKNLPDPSIAVQNKLSKKDSQNYFSVYDTKTKRLNSLGDSIIKTLEKELYASVYTNDSAVETALAQLKTKGDWGSIQRIFDEVIAPQHSGEGIFVMMAKELWEATNTRILQNISKLPEKI